MAQSRNNNAMIDMSCNMNTPRPGSTNTMIDLSEDNTSTNSTNQIIHVPGGCKPSKHNCGPGGPGCNKAVEIEILKNDVEKLKEFAKDSADGKSIQNNSDLKLEVKGFEDAPVNTIVMKESENSVAWKKPELVAEHLEGDPSDEYCLSFKLN